MPYVYHGSAAGLFTSSAWTAESNQSDARFGRSVASAGDVNGDGYSDVIVGAFYYDNGESDEGRAYVYHGSPPPLNCTCGDICVNDSGWWRDGGAFIANTTPIQAAVDNAGSGETICVAAGSYTENVDIATAHLTLRGEGADLVIVTAANPDDHVFYVTADYVNISGFTATGTTGDLCAGICLSGADYCDISENDCSNNDDGIWLESSSDNTLDGNTANSNSYHGICLAHSSNHNTLTSNTADSNNNGDGIHLHSSSNNTLLGNNASSNNYRGICLYSSSNYNTFDGNTLSSNTQWDIYIRSSDATFANNTLNGTTISFTYGGDVSLKGAGSPAADPAGQQTIGKFINATSQSAGAWLLLNFSYSDADVTGLDESDLKVWKHDGTTWLEDGWNGTRYLDTAGNVVGVNATSFSVFAPAAPLPPLNCTCGDICVNEDGWWRDGGSLNTSTTPIQAAVDNAIAGETICVAAGNYTENVDIATPHLTLRGEGAGVVTVTAASSDDHVFDVTADYVNISGFTATGATTHPGAGIYLGGADHCNISDNDCSNNYYGIYLYSSSNNTLASNTANSNNGDGIFLYYSSSNVLTDNTANSNDRGIYMCGSSYNTLTSNNASSNIHHGICLAYSSNHNTLTSNTASNNDGGIWLSTSSDNTLTSNTANSNIHHGICLAYSSNHNTLTSNTADSNNNDGIHLHSSSNNALASNNASSNNYRGIFLYSSSNYNTFDGNTLSSNTQCDIYITDSDSTFTNNTLNGTTISFTYGGDVSLKGAGSPAADPAGQQTIGKFINATNQSAGAWLLLNFSYSDEDVGGLNESDLVVWKHDGTTWLEDGWNGTRYLDTAGNVVGVEIVSFSVFAPAAPKIGANYIPPDPTNLQNTIGEYWVNYTWSAGAGNVTDNYNVNLNGTWTNGTAETFMNVSVGPGGWANITVFAYNASGTGTLSAGSVSDEVQAPAAPPGNYVPPDPTDLRNTTGSYWVNYTWAAGTGINATDSYNVSLNGAWTNGTANTFMNTSVGPSGWANITVFAYNASGTGTLSAGSVSDEVQAPAAPPGNYVPPDPTDLRNTTGSYWVNYTWAAGTGINATDSYNVSLNGAWTNGTADTFANASVGQSGWANITVFAYNASGTGTLSAESVSDEVQAPAAPAPIVSYGESVHAKKNVRFAWRALGAPDGKGALMSRNARIAIELEDAIPDCEEVSIRVRKAGLRTPRFKVLVSSDGETWTQVGSASCSSSAWTRYDFTGDWSDVKYIAIQKPGTWRRPNLMGLDAVRAEGLS